MNDLGEIIAVLVVGVIIFVLGMCAGFSLKAHDNCEDLGGAYVSGKCLKSSALLVEKEQ